MCKMASFVSKECGTVVPEFVTSGDDGALPGVVRSDGHACEHFLNSILDDVFPPPLSPLNHHHPPWRSTPTL